MLWARGVCAARVVLLPGKCWLLGIAFPVLLSRVPCLAALVCRPQVKGVADAGAASMRVSGLELGGLVGSMLAGKLSDILITSSKGKGGNVGKRIQVGPAGGDRAKRLLASALRRTESVLPRLACMLCAHPRIHPRPLIR